ncbi:GntR family transcriptional regulator (plasmid) [Rhizobium leguminosarum]|nr:GntR family transcriptional regulator [Rhizobium leguminosarum]TBG93393.1 GntR family transcriptional regulator [Rhizobium leguminosarum]TBG95987.1 GntR family transcriptional regulator [Rhizobium leguminosarum]TBH28773.1 GntR family transcriptional regulator [Rhizobium leguminosarum]TBH59514.1 GntR family transcriptional regulator [Rhizobium leguminosarum]
MTIMSRRDLINICRLFQATEGWPPMPSRETGTRLWRSLAGPLGAIACRPKTTYIRSMVRQPSPLPYYEIVRQIIADNIDSGALPSGTRLLTSAVADRLGVSRPPVKRALQLLADDGLITPVGSQGYVVGAGNDNRASKTNLFSLPLDLPAELNASFGQASWERIFETVEADIMNCIPFGTFQISEPAIADYFDVSRTVVRDVLSRMDARGLIAKDRSSHWIAGPFSARMLDDAHEIRRLLEPGALVAAIPQMPRSLVDEARARIEDARRSSSGLSREHMDEIEHDLHVLCLEGARNRRLVQSVRLNQISLVINRLFGTYIGVHDEGDLLREHALVLDHLLVGDSAGASVAMQYHLDADHLRTRARLKVLSVFDAAEIAPYLTRIH